MESNQKGFITLPLTAWIAIGAGVVILGMGIALKVQSSRLEACEAKYQAFVSETKRLGEVAEKEAKRINQENKAKKEKADAELKKLRADNAALDKRVRDNASRSFVPRTTADTSKPERACFDQAAVDRAIREFAERVAELITEGQNAITDLDNAKAWANKIPN